MLPDFLVIGAQKCGTSWLNRQLARHPQICMARTKDMEFFSYARHLEQPGVAWYEEQFAHCRDADAVGEVSASYFWNGNNDPSPWNRKPPGFNGNIPATVRAVLGPDVRLIVILRNPVERAISAYLHHVAMGDLDFSLDPVAAGEFAGLVHMGFYSRHLADWLGTFAFDQILVLIYEEDVKASPEAGLHKCCRFLGVDPSVQGAGLEEIVFEGVPRVRIDGEVWVPVDRTGPGAKVPSTGGEGPDRAVLKSGFRRVVSGRDIERLAAIYRDDVRALANLLGRDLANLWGTA